MAVKPCSLRIDGRQREVENRGTPMFPCGGYTTVVGDFSNCIPWHWHEEVEVMAVDSGILSVDVSGQTVVLRKGEAAFINSGVLHSAVSGDSGVCEVRSLVFDPQVIYGALDSAIEQKYVRPLINCPQRNILHLSNGLQWQRDAIRSIHQTLSHYWTESYGFELLVRDCLSRLWFLIVSNSQQELEQHRNSTNADSSRMREMLGWIHAHFADTICLKDISRAAAISERECTRCFNRMLGMPPMKYLLQYRISIAAGLLTGSDCNITEICRLCGFASPSYFSQKFKALTDMTPRAFRLRGSRSREQGHE